MPVLRYIKQRRSSCISIPKCNVRQQNIDIKHWMKANPTKVTILEDGLSTDSRNQFNNKKSK